LEIVVLDRQRYRRISSGGLRGFMRKVVKEVPPPESDEVVLCLVSDRRMREYNRRFRGVDSPTDVLSFPGEGAEDPEGRIHLGDILISVTAADRQARRARHTLAREMKILALHGYLHLLGYDHERDRGEMNRIQRRIVRRLLPRSVKGNNS
jgi:probable rRNA maturation factor